jgi:hypothetical protein
MFENYPFTKIIIHFRDCQANVKCPHKSVLQKMYFRKNTAKHTLVTLFLNCKWITVCRTLNIVRTVSATTKFLAGFLNLSDLTLKKGRGAVPSLSHL